MDCRQVTPVTWRDVAAWCDSVPVVDDDGNQAVDLPTGARVPLGWWIGRDDDAGGLTVVDPATYNQTYRS